MSERLRICHLASGDLWAGAEVQMFTLVKRLAQDTSLELSTVLLNEGRLANELKDAGIPTAIYDESRLGAFALSRALGRHFRELSADLVHTHRYKENILGSRAARRAGVRAVVRTLHGWPEPYGGLRAARMRLYQHIDRRTNRYVVDRVIAVSEQIRDGLDYPDGRVVCIHNGVDVPALPSPSAPTRTGEPLIGTIGRLTPVKGHELLVRALPELLRAVPGARLQLLGDGPLEQELRELAEELDLSDRIELAGHVDDVAERIAALDLVVFPSLSEGIPMALLEAHALERPVVASRVGGMPEVIRDGENGLLVEPSDPGALAAACARVLGENGLARRLGAAGRRTVVERFSAESNATRTAALYRELLA